MNLIQSSFSGNFVENMQSSKESVLISLHFPYCPQLKPDEAAGDLGAIMGYQIRDRRGNVIGEMETDSEREGREFSEGCIGVIVLLALIGGAIVQYWYIVLIIAIVGVVIWLVLKADKKETKGEKIVTKKSSRTSSAMPYAVEAHSVVPKQFKYVNDTVKTIHIGKELEDTVCHSWIVDSIEIGDKYTIVNMTTIPKTDNTYAYSDEDYIEDVVTGNRYKAITNTLGTKKRPKILRKPVPYSFKKVYPALPPDIDTISIWSDGKCEVDELRIAAMEIEQ